MSRFAHVTNGVVDQVIVIEPEVLEQAGRWFCPACGTHKDKSEWVQTSYNTQNGVHTLGGTPLRKNYAGIGFTYDQVRDAFIPVKPFNSWLLDETNCDWKAPKDRSALKNGFATEWDENTQNWIERPLTNKEKQIWQ